MKMYPTNNLVPVNSKQRQPDNVAIPVFNFVGVSEFSAVSDKWYPPTNMRITGGYVTSSTVGYSYNEFVLYKNNIFEQNIDAGIARLEAGDTKSLFEISNELSVGYYGGYPYIAASIFTPFDYLVVSMEFGSLHAGITVQLFGEKIN